MHSSYTGTAFNQLAIGVHGLTVIPGVVLSQSKLLKTYMQHHEALFSYFTLNLHSLLMQNRPMWCW